MFVNEDAACQDYVSSFRPLAQRLTKYNQYYYNSIKHDCSTASVILNKSQKLYIIVHLVSQPACWLHCRYLLIFKDFLALALFQ